MKRKWKIKAPSSVFVLCFLHFVPSSLSQSNFDPSSVIPYEKETIELLEKHAKKLSVENFYNDPILVQTVSADKVLYTYTPTAKTVFTNGKVNDIDKEIIIVGSDENQFAIPTPRDGKRRQFILLKKSTSQKSTDNGTEYYVSFIYLRNVQPNETYTDTLTIGGIKSVPEYDIWEHRPTKFYPGWKNCDFSVMFTCTSLRALAEDARKRAKARGKRDVTSIGYENRYSRIRREVVEGDGKSLPPPELLPFQLLKGYDPRDLKDLHHDYDYQRFKLEGEIEEAEKEENDRIDEEQRKIAKESGLEIPENAWKGEVKQDEMDEDQKELETDLQKLEEDRKKHEKNKHKYNLDKNKEDDDMVIDVDQDEDYTVDFEERRSPIFSDLILTRKKRQIDEEEEIGRQNQRRLQQLLKAANESELGAYLYEPATGMREAPGLKSILLVGNSDKELKGILDTAMTITDGTLVLGPAPGTVVKKGILVPNENDDSINGDGYRWVSHRKKGNRFDDLDEDDAIEVPGNARIQSWDIVDFNAVEIIAPHLYKVGYSWPEARLAIMGNQIAEHAHDLITEIHAIKWRMGTDTIGNALNAGPFHRKGFKGNHSFPSNYEIQFGIAFAGAGISGNMFFFPWASLTKSTYIYGDTSVSGYFMPSLPGSPDGFYPDDEEAAKKLYDVRGKIIPEGFKTTNQDLGIWGYLRKGYLFNSEVPKQKALYDHTAPEWTGEEMWVPPTNDKCPERPETTKLGRKILYGHIFPGMVESPHMFIADGDSVSGYFILMDENFPEFEGAIHGVFSPAILGGHAVFLADSLQEVEYLKESRGVFTPDAMGYGGGISGTLSRSDVNPQKYILHLDRPSVEFMYIEGYHDTKDVWSSYLKPGQWKWALPSLDDEDNEDDPIDFNPMPKSAKSPELKAASNMNDDEDEEYIISSYGTKVTARKTEALIPINFEISGTLIIVPLNTTLKMKAFDADLIGNKPEIPMKCTVYLNKTAKNEAATEKQMKQYNGATGIFIPHKFPKGDAIVATYKYGQLKASQHFKSHFWEYDQPIWTPLGYLEKMEASVGDKNDETKEKAEAAEREAKEKFAPEAHRRGMPGVLTKARPQAKRIANYKFGSLHDGESDDMRDTYAELNLLPHLYSFGYFIKYKESSHPVFVPESGVIGQFIPDNTSYPRDQVYFFPQRGNHTARFLFKGASKNLDRGRVKGIFQPTYRRPSVGFIPCKLEKGMLVPLGPPDVVPGWKQVDVPALTAAKLPKGWDKVLEEDQIRPTKKKLKYILIELGGGFRGVVVQGAESVDDPNNPIFQQYLHYKALRDGDVNPFGVVNIVEPIDREEVDANETKVSKNEEGIFGGITKLGRGTFVDEMHKPGSMANEIMKQFSVRHWEYKKIGEVTSESGAKREPLKLGRQDNVVNMMDFRMFLFKRYSLKRAKYNSVWARIYIPFGAEPFLTVKKKAKPAKRWIERMVSSGTTCSLLCKSTSVNFAIHFQLDPDEIIKFERPSGEDVPDFDDLESHPSSENDALAAVVGWGDDTVCDEIWLDPFQVAQLSVSIQKAKDATGVDLGYLLTSSIGQDLRYAKILKKLLQIMDEVAKDKEEKLRLPPKGPQMTDILGDTREEVEKKVDEVNDEGDGGDDDDEGSKQKSSSKISGKTFTIEEHVQDHARVLVGWKTQWKHIKGNQTFGAKGLIFYGLGNCQQKEVPNIKLWKSSKPKQILKYYLKVLRINCMENTRQRMLNLINEGYLEMDKETKFFRIPFGLKVARNLRATPSELKKLSVAFEFHAFTRTYYSLRQKPTLKEPILKEPYCTISRDVGFITEMTLYIISRAPRMVPAHSVRIIRNLLATLRTIMTKLYQDGLILEGCNECNLDKMLNKGEQFRITCLIEFIIHVLGPYESGELMLRPAFRKFVHLNTAALKQRVLEFGRHFPRKPPVTHVPPET